MDYEPNGSYFQENTLRLHRNCPNHRGRRFFTYPVPDLGRPLLRTDLEIARNCFDSRWFSLSKTADSLRPRSTWSETSALLRNRTCTWTDRKSRSASLLSLCSFSSDWHHLRSFDDQLCSFGDHLRSFCYRSPRRLKCGRPLRSKTIA